METTNLIIDKTSLSVKPGTDIAVKYEFQSDPEEQDLPPNSRRNPSWFDVWPQILASVIAVSSIMQNGVHLAYSGVLIPQLADDPNIKEFTKVHASWIASLLGISQPIGALIVGPIMDLIGRKKTCIIANIPVFIGWIMIYFTTYSLWPIYLARILAGLSCGMTTAGIVYTAEVSHVQFRSMLLSLNAVNVAFGILIVTVLGVYLEWHLAAIFYGLCALLSILLSFFIPESPYWLANFTNTPMKTIKSQVQYLNRSKWLFDEEWKVIEKLADDRRNNVNKENLSAYNTRRFFKQFSERTSYIPLILLFILFLLQQTSGTYVVIFYSVNIFKSCGGQFGLGIDAYNATAILGVLRFVISSVAALLSKNVGRRKLLIISSLGMAISSIATTVFLEINNISTVRFESSNSNVSYVMENIAKSPATQAIQEDASLQIVGIANWWILISLLSFVSAGAFGQMIVPWTMMSELLPTNVRGSGSGLTVAYASLLMFFVIKTFPFILDIITLPYVFLSYALISMLAIIFVYFYLPETLGKNFAEIAKNFEKKS